MSDDAFDKEGRGASQDPQCDVSRRNFLRGLARTALLSCAVIGIGGLMTRRGESCTSNGICRGCPTLRDCGLPQALSLKQAQARES